MTSGHGGNRVNRAKGLTPHEPRCASHQESNPSQRECRDAGYPNGRYANVAYSSAAVWGCVALLSSTRCNRTRFNERHCLPQPFREQEGA